MDIAFGQRCGAAHQVILMAAKGRAGIMINVVADEMDVAVHVHGAHGLQENRVASLVVAQDIQQAQAFGRAILEVAHVDVATSAVEKKPSVAGRFVPVALMNVNETQALLAENPITHSRDGAWRTREVAGQTPVLGFQANDAVTGGICPFRPSCIYRPSSPALGAW